MLGCRIFLSLQPSPHAQCTPALNFLACPSFLLLSQLRAFTAPRRGQMNAGCDCLKLLKYLNPALLKRNVQTFLSLFSSCLLTLLPSLGDHARLWSRPSWQEHSGGKRRGAPVNAS